MSAVTISGYTTSLTGVHNFTDADHPGYGKTYLILNGQEGRLTWDDVPQSNTHIVTFCIPWENVLSFRQYVLMSTVVVSGVSVRTQPMQSPYVAQFPNTYALRTRGKGSGSDANVSDARLYSDCIVEVEFGTLPFPVEGDGAFLEINVAGAADYDTIPDAALSFSSGEKIDHDAGVLVGSKDIQITAHLIPDPDSWEANLDALKGKVNSAGVTIGAITYAAGYLMFPTYDLSRAIDLNGNILAEGTIHLLQKDVPWNSGIRSDGVVDTITPAPYATADLNGVFTA